MLKTIFISTKWIPLYKPFYECVCVRLCQFSASIEFSITKPWRIRILQVLLQSNSSIYKTHVPVVKLKNLCEWVGCSFIHSKMFNTWKLLYKIFISIFIWTENSHCHLCARTSACVLRNPVWYYLFILSTFHIIKA